MELKTFDLLKQLSESLEGASCLPQEPFMKLGAGNAPILNYSLEQKSSFTSYGHFLVDIPNDQFKGSANTAPANNVFDRVAKMTIDEVKAELRKDVKRGANTILKTVSGETLRTTEIQNIDDTPDASLRIGNTGATTDEIAEAVTAGKIPVTYRKMGKFKSVIKELSRPIAPKGKIFVIEEYTTSSYLGDYGAGQTLKTFSLLPDEKTTITLRTFETSTEKKSRSENVLDSFSESSTDEMENTMEEENSLSDSSSNSTSKTNDVSLSASGKLFGVVNVSASASHTSSKNSTANRAANTRALGRALEKHVQNSNSNREIAINQSSESTTTTEVEETTIRELVNPNKSRVLNFVFRQLLQEYVTITYLSNIRIAFCNGYMESLKVVDLEDLDTIIDEFIVDDDKTKMSVKNSILKHYCKVFNYKNDLKDFIEKIVVDYGSCLEGVKGTETFWRIKPDLQDTYSRNGGLEINVRGVILNVQTNTLRTSSVVADALLGQGEALDCFNTRLQDSAALKTHLENAALLQQMEIISEVESQDKPSAYKKVFGDCCASDVIVPQ
ncbi:MAG: hypothetical protein ACPGXZ_07960 [Saprospiraceae bacterium]